MKILLTYSLSNISYPYLKRHFSPYPEQKKTDSTTWLDGKNVLTSIVVVAYTPSNVITRSSPLEREHSYLEKGKAGLSAPNIPAR